MKVNELLEAVATPEDKANKIREEFRTLLKDAGVVANLLDVSYKHANKSKGTIARTSIFSIVIPKIENDEYDADEAEIALRLAHRLISKWLDKKEADGQSVDVDRYSDVGGGHKFSTEPYRIWKAGPKCIIIPSIFVTVSIADKEDTAVVK
jgi:hypothetical protein